jgi:hypothetical protein
VHRSSQYLALTFTMLAAGCCLPPLSGRYDQRPPAAANSVSCACGNQHDRRLARHRGEHSQGRWPWGNPHDPGTPPGELVPLPKFHPVPVRPVFEPQYDYSLPQFLGPVPHEAFAPPQISTGMPTPANPIPDPA